MRPVEVFAGGFVDEPLVERHTFELAQLFLVERAHTQVADHLTARRFPFVTLGSLAFTILCHNNRIITHVRRANLSHVRRLAGVYPASIAD